MRSWLPSGWMRARPCRKLAAQALPSRVWATSSSQLVRPVIGFSQDPQTGASIPVLGQPGNISGFRLEDGRASYGLGLQTFALGFPIHFDWTWRTLFNKGWEDALFATTGGSQEFRKSRFAIWMGYDF